MILRAKARGPFHHKMAGNVFQLFGHVLAELLERTVAIAAVITGREDFKVIGQRAKIMGALGEGIFIALVLRYRTLRNARRSNLSIFLQIERQLMCRSHRSRFVDMPLVRASPYRPRGQYITAHRGLTEDRTWCNRGSESP